MTKKNRIIQYMLPCECVSDGLLGDETEHYSKKKKHITENIEESIDGVR